MGKEIERKFLLAKGTSIPIPAKYSNIKIKQAYICAEKGKQVRIRITRDNPRIGLDIGAIPVLRRLVAEGHKLVIFTMRSGSTLDDGVKWFEKNGIPLFGINRNPTQVWTKSPKAYGELYIDDAALGCPLSFDPTKSNRPFVNWSMVELLLEQQGILTPINREENV